MNDIQELRKRTGMSQGRFAEYFGIPKSTLQDWEHGRRTPPPYIPGMIRRILELEAYVKKSEEWGNTHEEKP